MNLAVVILAAGQGTRMKSRIPKVLHPIAGRPMIDYSLSAASALAAGKPTLVVGHESEAIRQYVGDRAEYVEQREQKGTGHAVLQARAALEGRADAVFVIYADMPLLRAETLQDLLARHMDSRACVTMVTVESDDPMGFGRIVRSPDGKIERIVEESEATPEQLAIRELNCGVYCFDAAWLWDHLLRLKPSPRKQELFLTDLVEMAAREGTPPDSIAITDVPQVMGINTRVQLAAVERIARDRVREELMLGGVTLVDPPASYIDAGVEIGQDTVILPGCHILGKTRIGAGCRIGPMAQIRDCTIGNDCEIGASLLEETVLEERVHVGPYCHARPGTYLGSETHLGDHAELKNARLGPGVKMGHFSYLGDAEVGARVNIGAGTITCNFDGKKKNRTVIGEDAFIGSDTMLVAPVTVGPRSKTGAGSIVTKDIPADSLAYGVPARVARRVDQS